MFLFQAIQIMESNSDNEMNPEIGFPPPGTPHLVCFVPGCNKRFATERFYMDHIDWHTKERIKQRRKYIKKHKYFDKLLNNIQIKSLGKQGKKKMELPNRAMTCKTKKNEAHV